MRGGGNRIYGLRVNAEFSTIFEDFVVQGRGLIDLSSMIMEDKDFPRKQQHRFQH